MRDLIEATTLEKAFLERFSRKGRIGALFADAQNQTALGALAVEYLYGVIRRRFPTRQFSELNYLTHRIGGEDWRARAFRFGAGFKL